MAKVDIGRSIADSLSLLKGNPVVLVPIIVAAAAATALNDYLRTTVHFAALSIYYILGYLVILFLVSTVIRMVYDAARGKASLSEGVKAAARRYVFFLATSILFGLIVVLGTIAIIIPGVFLGVKLHYWAYALLIEDEGITGSLKRSWRIVRGNWWRTFALGIIFLLPISLLFIIAELVPPPGTQIIGFIAALGYGWYYAAFTVAFLQLTAAVPTSTEAGLAEDPGQGTD